MELRKKDPWNKGRVRQALGLKAPATHFVDAIEDHIKKRAVLGDELLMEMILGGRHTGRTTLAQIGAVTEAMNGRHVIVVGKHLANRVRESVHSLGGNVALVVVMTLSAYDRARRQGDLRPGYVDHYEWETTI
jgi:DNA-binding FrmR family transcriptional regulator